jgi:hypothetical protein
MKVKTNGARKKLASFMHRESDRTRKISNRPRK